MFTLERVPPSMLIGACAGILRLRPGRGPTWARPSDWPLHDHSRSMLGQRPRSPPIRCESQLESLPVPLLCDMAAPDQPPRNPRGGFIALALCDPSSPPDPARPHVGTPRYGPSKTCTSVYAARRSACGRLRSASSTRGGGLRYGQAEPGACLESRSSRPSLPPRTPKEIPQDPRPGGTKR